MKKLLVILLSAMLLTGLVACGDKTATYKVGFGTETSVSATDGQYANAGKKVFEASVAYAGVVVDKDGKIVKLFIDEAQNQAVLDNGVLTNPDTSKATKKELKENYGMGVISPIEKEWYEQIEALEAYAVGKKVSDFVGMELDADGFPTDEAVLATTTIELDVILKAVKKAGENLTEVKGAVKVGLGSTSIVNLQYGAPQVASTMAMVAVDKDGKLLYTYIDTSQNLATVDKTDPNNVTVSADTRSKKELKDEYNMGPVSPIGKEWYEQLEALQVYSLNKTVKDFIGLAVDADGTPTGDDIKASVTVTVNDYLKAVETAGNNLFELK